jgi:uncharacterized tellurite resistance protein B-like protein
MIRIFRKPLRLLIVLGVAVIALTPKAQAQGASLFGTKEQMSYVAATKMSAPGGAPFSLCHLTRKSHVLYLGYWRASLGYVLSDAGCDAGAAFYQIDAQGVGDARAAGLLPRTTPDTARMSLPDLVTGFAGLGLLAALLAGLSGARLMRRRNLMIRQEILNISDPAVFGFIDAMCHAARADQRTGDDEIAHILHVARDLTGLDYTEAHIRAAIVHCPRLSQAHDFRRFGRGMTLGQRQMILQGALAVVAADGDMAPAEKRFLKAMAKGMGLAKPEVEAVVARAFARLRSPAGAGLA